MKKKGMILPVRFKELTKEEKLSILSGSHTGSIDRQSGHIELTDEELSSIRGGVYILEGKR